MATDRVIPIREDIAAQVITITASDASPDACTILGQGQRVRFENNSKSSINIKFETNLFTPAVFHDMLIRSTDSYTQEPEAANLTVNYWVYEDGSERRGPYAIQVGTGPLFVQIKYVPDDGADVGEAVVTPQKVKIPCHGWLELVSSDYNYNVAWDPFDPFEDAQNPAGLASVGAGLSKNAPHQERKGVTNKEYDFTVSESGPPPTKPHRGKIKGGGGTVKTGS